MKLFFAGLVVTAAAVSAIAVPAQAASVASAQDARVGPVKALKAQLVPGKGVKITESSGITLDFTVNDRTMQVQVNTRKIGTLAFGKGSSGAADVRVRMSSRQDGNTPPYRVIAEGGNAYVTNAGIAKALPSGRSWIRSKAGGHEDAVLDTLTPAELQFMLDNTSEVGTREYQGTATLAAPASGKVISEKKLNAKTRKAVMKAGYPESGPF